MALRGLKRREVVKKSSYYVWFLGAQESGGLRGEEYMQPAVRHLLEREQETEPLKVTLQVSSKGLKIIQNGVGLNGSSVSSPGVGSGAGGAGGGGGGGSLSSAHGGKNKLELVKHFIPDHSITCVMQDLSPNEDVVACVLLIYNPVSKCPVHVHAYRCDSVETAVILRQQLQSLVDHPENQKRFAELEMRLKAKGLLPVQKHPSLPSSGPSSSRTESDASGGGGGGGSSNDSYTMDERMANLYDSLAAELREKLNNKKNDGPILLPPRDYDTTHRMKGKLDKIDQRRCLQQGIVGPLRKEGHVPVAKLSETTKMSARSPDSSGKSSGIGSDEAPGSPTHERGIRLDPEPVGLLDTPMPSGRKVLADDDESSSDEDWKANRDPQARGSRDMLLVQSPPRFRRSAFVAAANKSRLVRSPSPTSLPVQLPYSVNDQRKQQVSNDSKALHHDIDDYNIQRHYPPNARRHVPSEVKHGFERKQGHANHNSDSEKIDQHPSSQNVQYNSHVHEKPLLRRSQSRDSARQCHVLQESSDGLTKNCRSHSQVMERYKGDHQQQQTSPYDCREDYERRRSYQKVSGHPDTYDRWTEEAIKCQLPLNNEPAFRSPLPSHQAQSKHHLTSEFDDHDVGYGRVPLPRVKRLDSGHSSSMSNGNNNNSFNHQPKMINSSPDHYPHSHNRKSTASRAANYQELPDNKRYPGLDRETARVQHHYLPTVNNSNRHMYRRSDSVTDLERTRDTRSRHAGTSPPRHPNQHGAEVNGDGSSNSYRSQDNLRGGSGEPSSSSRASRGLSSSRHHNQHYHQSQNLTATDDKLFYRYSSSDADRYGHRMPPLAYHF